MGAQLAVLKADGLVARKVVQTVDCSAVLMVSQ
jgi:hypothetical protein